MQREREQMKFALVSLAAAVCVLFAIVKINTDDQAHLYNHKIPVPQSIRTACEDVFDSLDANTCEGEECDDLYRDEATCLMLLEMYEWN